MSSRQRKHSPHSPSVSAQHSDQSALSPVIIPQSLVSTPAPNDRVAWKAYWIAQGQPWRTEPEIDQKRQAELARHRSLVPDLEQGLYPFAGMKLGRADVEWLLATHEHGRGPVDWSDISQRNREGLDLRGADLRGISLRGLPLARLHGGTSGGMATGDWIDLNLRQREMAMIHLEDADLRQAHLEGARLRGTHLERADMRDAYLTGADLFGCHLEGANLFEARLVAEGAGVSPFPYVAGDFEQFPPTILRQATFDSTTNLEGIVLGSGRREIVRLANVSWNGVNLSRVNWSAVAMLGDECQARQKLRNGNVKDRAFRLREYTDASQANRQLAMALQAQGLNVHAAKFAYRAQSLERHIFRLQMVQTGIPPRQRIQALSALLFSWFLFLIAGYGYKPGRSFLTYFLLIFGFATAYYFLGHAVGPLLSPLGAFVFSMTSFHGRGFFPGNNISLDDPLTVLAALEALVGLIIEVTFIATLTQRFFNW